LPGTVEQRWYLGSGGTANSRRGDGVLSRVPPATANTDAYVYDPESPVPSLGGHSCCTGTDTEAGGYDQSAIELRDDVLVYTSAPLPEGIEVTGLLSVTLQVSSSAKDTDFMAKLVDVYPDGRAFNIQEGALRMRYREGMDKEVLLEPGKNYEVRLDLHASSNFFDRGHRIRLEVTSSSFPRLERNLNTGGDNHNDTVWEVATNTVHHTPERLSYLSLPVVPSPQGVAGKHEDRPLRLRVMTLNAWGAGANAGKSIDETVAVIRAAGADVVGLQETRAEGTPCLGAICPPAGPSVAADIARQLGLFVYEQKQENDALWANAILSKYPIKRATDHDLGVVLDVHGRSVAVLNIHPTDFPYQPYQLLNIPYDSAPFLQTPDEAIAAAEAARGRAVDLLLGEVETLPAVDAVFITGDFNEPSHRDWTARAAQAGRHPLAVSFPTVRRIEAAGFVDTYRSLFPDEIANPGFTWTPTTGADDPQDHHDRIVFVLMRAPGAVIEAVEIVGEDASHADIVVSPWPSDHRAVVATVALPGTS
jgi:endonuclease/exonuclease/phosphatase family metal-dependent hydrolase